VFGLLEMALVGGLATCFVCVATLSIAEVSLIRVRRTEVAIEARLGARRSVELERLLDELPIVLNAVLLLVLLTQVASATIAGVLAQRLVGGIGVTAGSVAVTLVLFIYGEAIPKTAALRDPHRYALRVTPLLRVLVWVLRPLVIVLIRLANLQARGDEVLVAALTEAEIRALARESAAEGLIGQRDATLVERSFDFGDRTVRDVMVPREAIVAVDGEDMVWEALEIAIGAGHRRLLVRGGGLDDIIGFVRLRDLAALGTSEPDAAVTTATGEVLRCSPDCGIAVLLTDMQTTLIWIALIEDENGRTMGMATVEDLIAELVGEVADEHSPRS